MILKINDRIRTRKVDYFNSINVSLRYDSIGSTFSFGYYFNPDNIEHKEMSCVGHYHIVEIEHLDEVLLTGYILSQQFTDESVKQLANYSGYSLTGVLEDCEIPTSIYPLQSDGLTLLEIARKICNPFGIKIVVDPSVLDDMNKVYNTSTAKSDNNIKSYLTTLAKQRDIILSHTNKGKLLFTKANTNSLPIALIDGNTPGVTMSLQFNGQGMHSHITMVKEADIDNDNAGEYTVRNPYVPFVFRPRVIKQSSGDDIDTVKAAQNALAAELKNLVVNINVDRWDINGKIIRPNQIISVLNPEIYLYKRVDLFIESVDYFGDNERQTATLKCVLPEVYNGKTPKYLFEGINLH